MTLTTGTDEHPEVAEISALTEGVLSPSRTSDLRRHLADCDLCEDVRSSLDEIRGLLGTLPGPPRMPSDVAGRIEAALAAEALLDSTSPEADAHVSRETVSCEAVESVPVRVSPEPVSRETADRPAGRPRAATGPGRQTPGAGTANGDRRARRWPRVLLGSACAAAVIGAGGFFLQSQSGDSGTSGADGGQESPPPAVVLASGELGTRVQDLLGRPFQKAETRGMSSGNGAPEETGHTTLSAPGGAPTPSCVREGIGRPDTALAAEPDSYNGQDVHLVVLPHTGDTTLVDAYVVSSSCVTASPTAPGKVLVKRTLPRS
ncbi:hypothetical protein [Streptomyces albireticuli]|uniref:Zinc-finger domain-containing protein n=1 Tax=Streptomyces albireticuli TaxID=1940 RepID=A0A2A2D8I0_9ACTN|nr:hypothetical protein [Streptomyces albireticuli]MCD9143772.1 hypothetical protein [Streptomyces albireticuli]MCD9161797.1 hypothetical protein [Streptomyces albireticuli]MCD9191889.1 hypothetical protein [Streptomyces albireticuli]PAU48768.1 hypothetical protein CK936_11290 [Streptomyces albireticuli]